MSSTAIVFLQLMHIKRIEILETTFSDNHPHVTAGREGAELKVSKYVSFNLEFSAVPKRTKVMLQRHDFLTSYAFWDSLIFGNLYQNYL